MAGLLTISCRRRGLIFSQLAASLTVTGTSDVFLHVLARNMQHLATALERILSSAGIEHSESVAVLSNAYGHSVPSGWLSNPSRRVNPDADVISHMRYK